jgi:hypothetical protein
MLISFKKSTASLLKETLILSTPMDLQILQEHPPEVNAKVDNPIGSALVR